LKNLSLCFLLFSMFSTAVLWGQETNNFDIHAGIYYGNGIGKVKGIESNYLQGASVGVSKILNPNHAEWIDKLHAKRWNWSFLYTDMDGIQQHFSYGKSYSLATGLDFEILKYRLFSLYLSPKSGITYVTETVSTNSDTYIFGSHINFLFGFGLSAEYRLTENWSVDPYFQILHMSNGGLKLPNAGVNALVYGLTLHKKIANVKNTEPENATPSSEQMKTNGLELAAGIGWRGKYKSDSHFFRSGFYLGYSRYFNSYFALRSGVDVVYYGQVFNPEVYDDSIPYWGKSYDHFRAGLSVGAEVKFGKLALNANAGRYVYMKSPYHQKLYWNAAFRYYFVPTFGIQAGLNAHKFQADFLNFGIFCRL